MAAKASASKATHGEGDFAALLLDLAGSLKVTTRPVDVGALGSYLIASNSGTIAATMGAAKDVWAFRNDGPNVVIVRKVTVSVQTVGAPTAGTGRLGLYQARAFSSSYTTNGVAATLSGDNGKKKTGFASTSIAQIYTLDTNVNGITGATRTLDAAPCGLATFGIVATANSALLQNYVIYDGMQNGGAWPLILGVNEGLVLQNLIAWVGASSTWILTVTVDWDEVTVAP